MSLEYWAVTNSIKQILRMVCRVHDQPLAQIPTEGPLILVCNHINSIEVPLMFTHLQPRPITGFAKEETWDNPAMAYLFDLWGAIPLKRGEVDITAIKKALKALQAGKIVVIAPEGTRSGHGRLQRSYPGVVLVALHSGAPLMPVVYFGGEQIIENIKQIRRTDFHIEVGRPFYLDAHGKKVDRQLRLDMLDEIMFQLASLMPENYRGIYSDLSIASQKYLRFVDLPISRA